jgi:glycine C-acetyltransferase
LPDLGLVANLVEFPAVPKGAARIRMQVMADHTEKNIGDAVKILKAARTLAEQELEQLGTDNKPAKRIAA